MLNDADILKEVLNHHQRCDDRIGDFCDGEIFKNHPLFSRDPTALQIILYYDDVEVVNPLGSKTKKHKLGVFYYTLGNIKPENRSQLKAMQLLAVTEKPVIDKYGMDSFLSSFMDDLASLEQDAGHQFDVDGQPMSFAGTIAYLSGDNLGSQAVGGFKEGTATNRKCRNCLGEAVSIKSHFNESDFVMRTRESHNYHCTLVERDIDYGVVYGINRRSILNQSRYFHVIDGLPADIMHDLLEGVLQHEVKLLLKKCIENKFFTLKMLNERIESFDYGYYNDKNKPTPISPKTLASDTNTLKQKAVQMWCLGRFLPLLIGHYVPQEDEHWMLYNQLLQIMDILLAPVITRNQLGFLQVIINDHHESFRQLYPEASIIPKMHYLIHCPTQILKLGPMTRTWCMRFEAKHNPIKKLAHVTGNFKNLPLTVAKRSQLKQCSDLGRPDNGKLEKKVNIHEGAAICAKDSPYYQSLSNFDNTLKENDQLYESKAITIYGTEYRLGAIIHCGIVDLLPTFATITKIYIQNNTIGGIYFVLSRLTSQAYHQHYHAYEVGKPFVPQVLILRQNEFGMYIPNHIIRMPASRKMYVAPRYTVPEVDPLDG